MQLNYASIISCLFWVLTCSSLPAQIRKDTLPFRCGAPTLTPAQVKAIQQQAMLAFKRKMNARRSATEAITYVPIRPHIVRRSDGTGGFTLADLNQRMAFTNSHYLLNGSGIQFYFAGTTPDYIDNDQYYTAFPYAGGPAVDGRDATNAMNQYYVINLDGLFVNGIANFPFDNIVSTRSFIVIGDGSQPILSGHIVMPHELGHNFNLFHTHGPGNESATDELVTRGAGANCSYAGDQICDTPADPRFVPGGNSTITDANGCPQYDPNSTARDANGDPYMPMMTNIMSYWFSRCGFEFTPGQHERIQQALALRQTHTSYTLDAPATNVSPPTNLAAHTSYTNNSSVLLTWQDNADNEMGYFVERSTSPTDGFVPIDGVGPDVTSFRDTQTTPLTHYYYRIRPSNSTTDNLSFIVSITAGVPIVTGLTTSNITSASALLSWNSIDDGATYELRWRPVGTANWNTVSSTDTSYVVGLLSNTTYEWQVRVEGGETYAGPVYFTTLCPIPEYPGSNPSRVTASLSWSDITGQTYTVRWRMAGAATWNMINNITSRTYLLTGLTALTSYEWQVQGVCSATASSAFTDIKLFTTVACVNPYYAIANAVRSSSADISWSSFNEDPTRTAEIRYRVVGASDWTIITGINSASGITYIYSLTGLANNTAYEWQLRNTCSPTETSDYTPLATFTTTCRIPTNLSSGSVTATRASISWSINGPIDAGATYELNYRPLGSAGWTTIGGITGGPSITYPLTDLATDTQYEWRVRTICSASAQSDYASRLFTTTCNAPSANGLRASLVTSTSVQLNWYVVNDPGTSYTIRYRVVGAADWTSVTANTTNTFSGTYVLTGLTNNTTYEWQLQSVCSPTQQSAFIAGPTFTTQCKAPPYAYSAPTVSSALLFWDPAGVDVTYNVRYRTLGSTDWTDVSGITSASALITGLTVNQGYEWGVRTRCQDGIVTDYRAATFTTQPCTVPSYLQTSLITANSARLRWDFLYASPDTRFEIQYQAVGATTWISIPNLTVTNSSGAVDLTGLSPDTPYQWQIRSLCSSTETSVFSSAVSFRTLAPCPSMFTTKAGLWNDPTVWSCNRVPVNGDVVSIKHQVTIPANYVATAAQVGFDNGTTIIYETNAQLKMGF